MCGFYLLLKNQPNKQKTPSQTSQKSPIPSGYSKEKQHRKFSHSVTLSYFGEIVTKWKSESSAEFLLNCRVEMLL